MDEFLRQIIVKKLCHRIITFTPYPGGNYQYMVKVKENITLWIPNPHQGDIGEAFLVRLLKQAKIDRATWERL
jgi:hypothetical protein